MSEDDTYGWVVVACAFALMTVGFAAAALSFLAALSVAPLIPKKVRLAHSGH